MQGWHAHRLLGNDMYGDHILKDKDSISVSSRDKSLKGFRVLKRNKASSPERAFKVSRTKVNKSQKNALKYMRQLAIAPEASKGDAAPPVWVQEVRERRLPAASLYVGIQGQARPWKQGLSACRGDGPEEPNSSRRPRRRRIRCCAGSKILLDRE